MELINRLSHLDQRLFLRCAPYCQNRVVSTAARLVSRTGDGYLQVLLPVSLLLAGVQNGLVVFQVTAFAFLLERSLYWILKNTLKRRRPPVAIPWFRAVIKASDEFSFPSGHTSAAFLLASIFLVYTTPAIGTALFLWACLVGLSRLILGVHFPADILAGATLGSGIAWLTMQLF